MFLMGKKLRVNKPRLVLGYFEQNREILLYCYFTSLYEIKRLKINSLFLSVGVQSNHEAKLFSVRVRSIDPIPE